MNSRSTEKKNVTFVQNRKTILSQYYEVCAFMQSAWCLISAEVNFAYMGVYVCRWAASYTLLHTHPFNDPFPGLPRRADQKGKTSLDFTEARDSEWQWHQLGHIEVCMSLQTDNHARTPPLSFLQAGCPSCCPTNSVKALKATLS